MLAFHADATYHVLLLLFPQCLSWPAAMHESMAVAALLTLDIVDDDAEKLKSELESALSGSANMLWITDRDGREVGISVAQLGYIEFGAAGDRRIGFATD